ncbi:DUF262 domain-containing protein [Microbispora sp. ZYX-F-249]|uniref:DUF262 domain-containing protein n=1 Tax=Microbispora maris TaxID=3144104 RepID=A0ABV0AL73_9ACTN
MSDGPGVREEYFLDRPMDVEAEQEAADAPLEALEQPWNPVDIRVSSKNFSIRNVLDMIDEDELELAPDFQRNKVWKPGQRSRLIESILLQIPLPAFYFAADRDGSMKVVDGLQRLSTIHAFARESANQFALSDLEYLRNEQGKTFADLPVAWRRRFYQTQLVVHVIDAETPSQIKYDIFKRINTGGTPLNTQEIRHCMSKRRSREFLKDCAHHPAFAQAVGSSFVDHLRMADRELVLRFCAFRLLGVDRYEGAMDPFLDEALTVLDDPGKVGDARLAELRAEFVEAMTMARKVFGDNAFRKWPWNATSRYPVNRALFESWATALAAHPEAIDGREETIVRRARDLMTNDGFYLEAITTSTGDVRKVRYRFGTASEVVSSA